MSSATLAQKAYTQNSQTIATPRSAEFQVIGKVTHRMRRAIASQDFPQLALSIHENRRLWTALAVDVADPENNLPKELKARIIYLAEFTIEHSRKVLRKEANAITLLEVNAAILRGLQSDGASQ